MTPTTVAVDVGGTRIKLGLVREGTLLARQSIDARSHEPLADRLPHIAAVIVRMCDEAGCPTRACAALAMAFPALIDVAAKRVLNHYGKFTDAPQLDLAAWSHRKLGLPFVIDHDARTALLGEWKAGAGAGCNDLVMLTLGTGLGTSAVVEGRLLRGSHGQAGVLGGHLTVRLDGRLCTCGNRGCAEAEASTRALPELLHASGALRSASQHDYAAVIELAAAGDPRAAAVCNHTLAVWSALILTLVRAYDPQRVLIGGGIAAGIGRHLPELQARLDRRTGRAWGRVDIIPAALGNDAALIGCEFLARERVQP